MLTSDDTMTTRLGWSLTSGRIGRAPEGLDISAILDRLEAEMPNAAPEVQWTMNSALANIGINHPAYRERAIAIGEHLGIYRDYPVSRAALPRLRLFGLGRWLRGRDSDLYY